MFVLDQRVYIIVDETATPADVQNILPDGTLEIEDYKGNTYTLQPKDVFMNLKLALSRLFAGRV